MAQSKKIKRLKKEKESIDRLIIAERKKVNNKKMRLARMMIFCGGGKYLKFKSTPNSFHLMLGDLFFMVGIDEHDYHALWGGLSSTFTQIKKSKDRKASTLILEKAGNDFYQDQERKEPLFYPLTFFLGVLLKLKESATDSNLKRYQRLGVQLQKQKTKLWLKKRVESLRAYNQSKKEN